ncbi:glutamine--fructose-6-phosphate transaminase (isomerizing) [Paenibacillus campi]|uniref:glutamine--fructose-6-phosphate transaminase (isomerizing) n=1 Tax=Paenibacillus campi TaxID=3106031 RepID=UPI002AFE16F5|nr:MULTISPECIES: glutamine--fructose-6-phosphate transaminase (isomerizing) [unclassified Paenibacillus]
MCGIVGYIGQQLDTEHFLLSGLEKLEYRGYDSAGIALLNDEGVHVFKEKGRISDLRNTIQASIPATQGIGQTRWATHGAPNKINAHPHQSASRRFTLVHNGVIENYESLYDTYLANVPLQSDTDTEIIVQLVETFVNEGLAVAEALLRVLNVLKGSYAIAMLDNEDQERIYICKNKSPLLVGLGDGTFNVFGSDALPMIHVTKTFVQLLDEEMVIVERDKITIKNLKGETIVRDSFEMELDLDDIQKGTYDHYMLKEIDEQPFIVRKIIQHYQDANQRLAIDADIVQAVADCERIYVIACGTSYHAGLIGKQYMENWAQVPVEVHIASEFSYNTPLLAKRALFIFISQSGETADSRAVLKKIKQLGYAALTITNVVGSTLSREADYSLFLHAGPEIAVASTKAYTAQITVLAILAAVTAEHKQISLAFDLMQELSVVANAMELVCERKPEMQHIAEHYLRHSRNAFFIGRHMDYYVILEGALKLKEISYIQAEGFAGGELKHGTIALIETDTPVIVLTTQSGTNLGIRSNAKEVAARGAHVCTIAMEGLARHDDQLLIPAVHEQLTPLLSVIPMQIISYYAALARGCDIDKPRNLAKSVTVE